MSSEAKEEEEEEVFEDDWQSPSEEAGRVGPWERMERVEVLEALFRGESFSYVARLAGVQLGYVKRWMKKLPLERLTDMEAKRIMAHLSQRDLAPEKYLALATAVGNLIDKVRLLRDEPTEILERRDTGKFDRLEAAIRRRALELRRSEESVAAISRSVAGDEEGVLGAPGGDEAGDT